jgi:hypothetical protein
MTNAPFAYGSCRGTIASELVDEFTVFWSSGALYAPSAFVDEVVEPPSKVDELRFSEV